MKIMFEIYDVPNFYIARSAAMSVYAKGRTTGLVIDSGSKVTQVVPVFEGDEKRHAV